MTEECCPKFDPTHWDGKVLEWNNKRFIRDQMLTFFYMPLNFARVIWRMNAKVEKSEASIPDRLCLFDHTSKWSLEVYLAVDREIPCAENVTLSGTFLSRVYEGPYEDTGKWLEDFNTYTTQQGREVKKWYIWYPLLYPTCATRAKKNVKNYGVILGKLS